MGKLREDFVLHQGVSIKDAMEALGYWRTGTEPGSNYKMWVQREYVRLERSWRPASNWWMLIFAPFIFGLICFLVSKARMIMTIWFSETTDAIGVHVLLEGRTDERMSDWISLRESLLAIGAPSEYLPAKPRFQEGPTIVDTIPETSGTPLSRVWAEISSNQCPYCRAEVPLDGITRPDGSVICPNCFGKFTPDRK